MQHGVRIVEKLKSDPEVVVWKHARRDLATRLIHYTSHTGLYKTERLRRLAVTAPPSGSPTTACSFPSCACKACGHR